MVSVVRVAEPGSSGASVIHLFSHVPCMLFPDHSPLYFFPDGKWIVGRWPFLSAGSEGRVMGRIRQLIDDQT
jgi:hypothetical protein